MKWTAVTVVMLVTTSFSLQEEVGNKSDEHHDENRSEFETNYGEILKELQACAVPSKNMFIRGEKDGQPQSSDFDSFCYFQAKDNALSLYLCRYYKSVVETYYGDHCRDPDRKPMDISAQYALLAQTPSGPCKILLEAVVYETQPGVNQRVFPSTESCEDVCHQSLFCINLAYLLSIRQSVDQSGGGENPGEVGPPSDEAGTGSKATELVDDAAENDDQGEDSPPVMEDVIKSPEESKDTQETSDQPGIDLSNKNEEIDSAEEGKDAEETDDQHDNEIPEGEVPGEEKEGDAVNVVSPNDSRFPDQSQEGADMNDLPPAFGDENQDRGLKEGLFGDINENEETEDENEENKEEGGLFGDSNENEETEDENEENKEVGVGVGSSSVQTVTLGGNFSVIDVGKEDDESHSSVEEIESSDSEDSEGDLFDQNFVPGDQGLKGDDSNVQNSGDQKGSLEKEIDLLEEEEASSHFLAYSLTAIILIMVTYILYHNKQKIVAIIIEGRNAPGGKRRRYNQNV